MASEDFRSDIREVLKRHELDSDDLRDLSEDLDRLASKWDAAEEVI